MLGLAAGRHLHALAHNDDPRPIVYLADLHRAEDGTARTLHALLEPDQRRTLAYLIRTGAISF